MDYDSFNEDEKISSEENFGVEVSASSEGDENAESLSSESDGKESKSEKFLRLGTTRVNKAINAISALENLSNTSSYDYTPEMVDKMFGAIEQRLSEVKEKFQKQEKTKESFHF